MRHDPAASRPAVPRGRGAAQALEGLLGGDGEGAQGPRGPAAGEHVAARREPAADSGEGPPTGGSRAGTRAGGRKDRVIFRTAGDVFSLFFCSK